MIPVKYTIRNLRARWVTTVLTACGTGLVVWASVLSFGLSDGLKRAMLISADKRGIVCLRKGSLDEVSTSSTSGRVSIRNQPLSSSMRLPNGGKAGITRGARSCRSPSCSLM